MPIKQAGYTQLKAHAKQDRKRREAYARQDKYNALSFAEKLDGMGKKHKARYDKQQAQKAAKKQAPVAMISTVKPAEAPKAKKKAYQKPKKS